MGAEIVTMPVVFVGHGSPMNAIEQNAFHTAWQALAQDVPQPESILCISAHWETPGLAVTATDEPETIHDFFGFPPALYEVRYPASGSPSLAHRTAALLAPEKVTMDARRGLDHGAWSVLVAMYPAANVPVVQLSLDTSQSPQQHYDFARRLAPLRKERVLILASGNIVHNLRQFDFSDPAPLPWAAEFNEHLKNLILAHRHSDLIAYESLGPVARLAIPTREHYLPLLYALALQEGDEPVRIFNDVVTSSISMTSLLTGG